MNKYLLMILVIIFINNYNPITDNKQIFPTPDFQYIGNDPNGNQIFIIYNKDILQLNKVKKKKKKKKKEEKISAYHIKEIN